MIRIEHIARMVVGWLLYWLVARPMPAAWWATKSGWFWWAVPHFGYYAYHPAEMKWWQRIEAN